MRHKGEMDWLGVCTVRKRAINHGTHVGANRRKGCNASENRIEWKWEREYGQMTVEWRGVYTK